MKPYGENPLVLKESSSHFLFILHAVYSVILSMEKEMYVRMLVSCWLADIGKAKKEWSTNQVTWYYHEAWIYDSVLMER